MSSEKFYSLFMLIQIIFFLVASRKEQQKKKSVFPPCKWTNFVEHPANAFITEGIKEKTNERKFS